MYVITVVQNGIQITGQGIGETFQCGLYNCLPYGTVGIKIFPIANPKIISFSTNSYANLSGALTPSSQNDAINKLGKLLAQNLAIGKFLVDGNDSTLGYFLSKVNFGAGVSYIINNVDGNETVTIFATGGSATMAIRTEVAGVKGQTVYNAFLGVTGKIITQIDNDGIIAKNNTWSYNPSTDVFETAAISVRTIGALRSP